jgi:flagellin
MSVINTKVLSLVTQNNLKSSQSALSTSIQCLSSGLRINSANDGVSLAQTAEGGLKEINNNLQRIRELTVQAKNGTNSAADITSIQPEVDSRLAEIDPVAGQTDVNSVKVLSAALNTSIQVGAKDTETIAITTAGASTAAVPLAGTTVAGAFDVSLDTLQDMDDAIATVDTTRGDLVRCRTGLIR